MIIFHSFIFLIISFTILTLVVVVVVISLIALKIHIIFFLFVVGTLIFSFIVVLVIPSLSFWLFSSTITSHIVSLVLVILLFLVQLLFYDESQLVGFFYCMDIPHTQLLLDGFPQSIDIFYHLLIPFVMTPLPNYQPIIFIISLCW